MANKKQHRSQEGEKEETLLIFCDIGPGRPPLFPSSLRYRKVQPLQRSTHVQSIVAENSSRNSAGSLPLCCFRHHFLFVIES